jgi:flagella basal body P-ring formation protein FlgA
MKRALIAIGLAVACLATPARAEQVILREAVAVNGGYVRLGDLFTNAGDKSDVIVAYAPAPGKRAIFDARWLYRVARGHRLSWRPLSPHDQVVVRRNSQVISREEIEDHILAALMEKGVGADTQVVLSNRSMRLHVPGDGNATIEVEDIALDRRSGRFSAIVAAPAGEPTAKRSRITGRLFQMTEVPVLNRRKASNQVIGKSDVTYKLIRSDRIHRDVVLDAQDLIGRAPRRTIRDGVPIRVGDVRHPVMVDKGSVVTMVLETPMMTLTAQGRALEDGSDGDTIRITNSQSSSVVQGVVVGAGKVRVRSGARTALN